MKIGELELVSLLDGRFRLDGGAMFGVVPKPLWEKRAPADERNRISLAMRPLLVRRAADGQPLMLIDAGLGGKTAGKFNDIYGVDRSTNVQTGLAALGLTVDDIPVVLATHLHFDHAGGFTTRDAAGGVRPAFPRARYVINRGEWEDASHPNERNRASYLSDDFLPLADAGVVEFMDGDGPVAAGVRVQRTGGHTRCHQIVYVESAGRTAVFTADLVPTTAHVDEPWIMGYDLYPMDTLAFKRAFLREAIERGHLIFFEHDPAVICGYVRERDGRKYIEAVA